ncbi:MAG: sigma-54 dependent transcriptional regulator, partial [Acidobacteriota bacterium]
MARNTVLVVDDQPSIRFAVRSFLETAGYDVAEAGDCRGTIASVEAVRPSVIVLDYELPDGEAIDLIPQIRDIDPVVPIIVVTGHGTIERAVAAVKMGAEQFLTKPVELPALRTVIERAIANSRSRSRDAVRARAAATRLPDPFVGTSGAIATLREQARRFAESDRPILIQGETGSGKGVLASWFHRASVRAEEPFVDINCAGLTRELLESELFGYEKGAFTGAVAAKQGLLELAHDGSVFLDEIGDMDLALQSKLLKVVEEKKFRRLGDVRDRRVDMRLIAATHHDLAAMAAAKTFRSDLYFRISTLRIVIPSLRERVEDIPSIAESFVASLCAELGRPSVRIAPEAMAALKRYSWPGNIRELRNVVERALILGEAGELRASALVFDLQSHGVSSAGAGAADGTLEEVERAHIL